MLATAPHAGREGMLATAPHAGREGMLATAPHAGREGMLATAPRADREGMLATAPHAGREGMLATAPHAGREGMLATVSFHWLVVGVFISFRLSLGTVGHITLHLGVVFGTSTLTKLASWSQDVNELPMVSEAHAMTDFTLPSLVRPSLGSEKPYGCLKTMCAALSSL